MPSPTEAAVQPAPPKLSRIARAATLVSALTMVSRVLGLVREAVVAAIFGASWQTDALFVSMRVPALLRSFLAEGVLTSAFVPTFTRVLREGGPERARRFGNAVFSLGLLVLPPLVLLLVLGSPLLISLFAAGFGDDPTKIELTVLLTRIHFPFVMLVSLTAVASGILNSLRHYAAPASASSVHNTGVILGALLLAPLFAEPVVGVAVGYLAGGVAMLLIQLPPLVRRGFAPRFERDVMQPPMGELLKLMGPAVFGVGVYQVNMLIAQLLASFLEDGAVSYLWYADRLVQLPLGVFAVAVATVSLTEMSDQAARGEHERVAETFNQSLRLTLFVTIPATAGLIVLAQPICALLFQRGAFDAADTRATAGVVLCFVSGLVAVSGMRVTAPVFYALKDTRTPVKVSCMVLAAYLLSAVPLMNVLAERGLALAASISAAAGFSTHLWLLRRRLGRIGGARVLSSAARSGVAALVMGLGCAGGLWAGEALGVRFDQGASVASLGLLVVLIGGGAALYAAAAWLLRAEELRGVLRRLRRA